MYSWSLKTKFDYSGSLMMDLFLKSFANIEQIKFLWHLRDRALKCPLVIL